MRLLACLAAALVVSGCADAERLIRDASPDPTSPSGTLPTGTPSPGTSPSTASPSTAGWPPVPTAVPVDVTDTWDTNWGAMTLRQEADGRVTGTYNSGASRIDARNDANTLSGFWIQASSTRECDRSRAGSRYWGRIQFVLVERDRWVGKYGYCDDVVDASADDWTATR